MNSHKKKNETYRFRKQTVATGKEGGGVSERGEGDEEIHISSYKINKTWGVICRTGNIVNNIVITLCRDKRLQGLSWWSHYEAYTC